MTAWQLWSSTYNETPNPLLALEMRILSARLGDTGASRILDAGTGTGRWLSRLGAHAFGIDACHEMLLQAPLHGRSARADLRCLPLCDNAFDTALCSFTLAYIPEIETALRELARVSRQIIVSDLHPDALRHGWKRSIRIPDGRIPNGRIVELPCLDHSIAALDHAAARAGLKQSWRMEASFGEPEREIFVRAGKASAFPDTCRIPAVLITAWHR